MNIFDLVSAKEIAVYVKSNPSLVVPYLGATLFPSKKKLGLDLAWFKGSKGLPVALMPSEFDAKATLRDRIGFTRVETEMPFFREAMRIGEKDRQELLKVKEAGEEYYLTLVNDIYDDVTNLVGGAEVQAERMRMQLLSTGKIAIMANRMSYDYNYNFDVNHKESLAGDARWSQIELATPITDIQDWQDTVESDTGTRPNKAVCTKKTWNYLLTNKSIRLDMNPIGGQNIIMTDAMLKQYLSTKLGLSVAVYNKKYKIQDGSTYQFFPDEVFTLIPDGNLGNTYFGTTPEEADLMSGETEAQVQIVNTGVAITTKKEVHPVNVETIVSAITLPSFETIDDIFIATVHS